MHVVPTPLPRFRPSLLTTLFFLLVHSQHTPALSFKTPKWVKNNFYSLSSDGPFVKHMLRQDGFNESINVINGFIAHVESGILSSLNKDTPDPQNLFQPCRISPRRFLHSMDTFFNLRYLPRLKDDCITDIVGTKLQKYEKPLYTVEMLFHAVKERVRLIEREKWHLFKTIAEWKHAKELLYGWREPVVISNSKWTRIDKTCNWTLVGAVRKGNKWYSSISLTNAPIEVAFPKKKRQYVDEFIYLDAKGKSISSMTFSLPTFKTQTEDGPRENKTTTGFSRLHGWPTQSFFYTVLPTENPAVQSAVAKADLPLQQASDALAPSSLSILFLPVLLNLVPITLITSVSTRVMAIYIVLSDLLTTVPLLIKGVELMITGRRSFRDVAVRMYSSMSGRQEASGAAELWIAECQAQGHIFTNGLVFVSSAFLFMVLGVGIELWACRFSQLRYERLLELKMAHSRICRDESYDDESYISSLRHSDSGPSNSP